jgi:DNA-3-methyladenine glycosylase II
MAPPRTFHRIDRPAVLAALTDTDPRLGDVIRRAGPFALKPRRHVGPYEGLFHAIVYQQLSWKAASIILGRVVALSGHPGYPTPSEVLATPVERLRGAGLSAAKTRAIRDLAARCLDGTVPDLKAARRLGDERLIERLTMVLGVGRWTAEMYLMFWLGRADVLPATDLGIRKGFQLTYRTRALPEPERILTHGRRWAPWRSIASWYLYRAVDLRRGG